MSEDHPSPEEVSKLLAQVKSSQLIQGFLGTLIGKAWENLGLWVNPSVGEARADLPEAKLAIDAAAALFTLIEGSLPDRERREIRGTLADLQVNYVQRAQ